MVAVYMMHLDITVIQLLVDLLIMLLPRQMVILWVVLVGVAVAVAVDGELLVVLQLEIMALLLLVQPVVKP